MLLIVEKGNAGGICHAIHLYAKANNKYMKDHDKSKESSHLEYCDLNNLCGWEMSQNVPVTNFDWVKNTCQFNEDFIKNYNEVIKYIFSKLMFNTLKNYMNFIT